MTEPKQRRTHGKRSRSKRSTFQVAVALCAASLCGSANSLAESFEIKGLDAHDGKIVQFEGLYYLYGTRYKQKSSVACCDSAFAWTEDTPWCGFGVWTSTDRVNWTFQGMLFDPLGNNPASPGPPYFESWQATCRIAGCFNPRMVRRTWDGAWILWFNAPNDFARFGANAYYAMGCAGPAGPCGPDFGGLTKPRLWTCHDNGDFDIVDDGLNGVFIICTMADQTLSVEKLDMWWTSGQQFFGQSNIFNMQNVQSCWDGVESPSVFGLGPFLYLTYSFPNCGYCSADGTGWARSANGMLGPWVRSLNLLSNVSCGGQPRTIELLDGLVWQWIDQWTSTGPGCFGNHNQGTANIHLEGIHVDANWNMLPFGC